MKKIVISLLSIIVVMQGCLNSKGAEIVESPTYLAIEKLEESYEDLAIYKATIHAPEGTRVYDGHGSHTIESDQMLDVVLISRLGSAPPSAGLSGGSGIYLTLYNYSFSYTHFIALPDRLLTSDNADDYMALDVGEYPLTENDLLTVFDQGDTTIKLGTLSPPENE